MRHSLPVLAAVAAVSLLTPGQTASGRGPALVVKKLGIKPGPVIPGNGATINLSVQFAQPMPRLAQVQAAGYVLTTGWGPAYPLTATGGGTFQGTCHMPVNRSTGIVRGYVTLLITTADGQQLQRQSLDMRVQPWYDSGPPPPPAK